ncbi:MAG: type II toxin-antitoxin system VapC family toxin [Turneriella sp.]
MELVLDTNAYVEVAKGNAAALQKLRRATTVHLTFVSLAELRAGFACGTKTQQNEKNLQHFLAAKRVNVLYADSETSLFYARIYATLRQNGTPIPTNNLWIAALALQHGLPVYSFDRHYQKVAAIDLIK